MGCFLVFFKLQSASCMWKSVPFLQFLKPVPCYLTSPHAHVYTHVTFWCSLARWFLRTSFQTNFLFHYLSGGWAEWCLSPHSPPGSFVHNGTGHGPDGRMGATWGSSVATGQTLCPCLGIGEMRCNRDERNFLWVLLYITVVIETLKGINCVCSTWSKWCF